MATQPEAQPTGPAGDLDVSDEVREVNLAYLVLAQNMIREDRAAAIYRLGISSELADILGTLSTGQLLRMAGSSVLLCRMRFDDHLVLNLLTSHGKAGSMPHSHAAILMAGRPVESVD